MAQSRKKLDFTDQEREILGHRSTYEGLDLGRIVPETDAHQHFLEVMQLRAPAVTPVEFAYLKFKALNPTLKPPFKCTGCTETLTTEHLMTGGDPLLCDECSSSNSDEGTTFPFPLCPDRPSGPFGQLGTGETLGKGAFTEGGFAGNPQPTLSRKGHHKKKGRPLPEESYPIKKKRRRK